MRGQTGLPAAVRIEASGYRAVILCYIGKVQPFIGEPVEHDRDLRRKAAIETASVDVRAK